MRIKRKNFDNIFIDTDQTIEPRKSAWYESDSWFWSPLKLYCSENYFGSSGNTICHRIYHISSFPQCPKVSSVPSRQTLSQRLSILKWIEKLLFSPLSFFVNFQRRFTYEPVDFHPYCYIFFQLIYILLCHLQYTYLFHCSFNFFLCTWKSFHCSMYRQLDLLINHCPLSNV